MPGRDATLGFMSICYVDTTVGRLAIEADHDAVTAVRWASPGESTRERSPSPVLKEATRQLKRYFARKLKRFDLPLAAYLPTDYVADDTLRLQLYRRLGGLAFTRDTLIPNRSIRPRTKFRMPAFCKN